MRISVNRAQLRAAAIAAVPALLLFAGLFYYFFLRPAYGVAHEDFLAPDTTVRAVVKPVLVQSYVSSLAPTGSRFVPGIPRVSSLQRGPFRTDWIHRMPLEFTLLLDHRSPEFQGVLLFILEHPAGEAFDQAVNALDLFHAMHPIRWEQQRLGRREGGRLIATGALTVPRADREAVTRAWPRYVPIDAPAIVGRHFIEVAVNNRSGGLMELHGALSHIVGLWASPDLERQMYLSWPNIIEGRLTGDLERPDLLRFDLELHFNGSDAANAAVAVAETAANALADYLRNRTGFVLEGSVSVSGPTLRGAYTLTGFEGRLRRALGG